MVRSVDSSVTLMTQPGQAGKAKPLTTKDSKEHEGKPKEAFVNLRVLCG
jgi:hypothetical protein